MKNIAILVPKSSVIQAIADPQYMFSAVNQFLVQAGQSALFNVALIGEEKSIELNNGMYTIHTDYLLTDDFKPELIIVPALFGEMEDAIRQNEEMKKWIQLNYSQGSEVASLCVGAFLLASTGLLQGKKCSTHWGFKDEFMTMFPNVELVEGEIVTEEAGIYSSGGAHSYWNLLLHILEKKTNRETAILTAKYFAIDIDRSSQAAFTIFKGQKMHEDVDVLKVQAYIEGNFSEKITIDFLAEYFGVGRRSLERRFKLATNNSILEYIQRSKIEYAKRCFESSYAQVNDVMYEVGYSDSNAFRKLFKKLTGLTPIDYKNKYSKVEIAS